MYEKIVSLDDIILNKDVVSDIFMQNIKDIKEVSLVFDDDKTFIRYRKRKDNEWIGFIAMNIINYI